MAVDWRRGHDPNTPDPPSCTKMSHAHAFKHPLDWEQYAKELGAMGPKHLLLALLRRELGRRERAISILQRKHVNLSLGKVFVASFKHQGRKGANRRKGKTQGNTKMKAKPKTKTKVTASKATAIGDWEDISDGTLAILKMTSKEHGGGEMHKKVKREHPS